MFFSDEAPQKQMTAQDVITASVSSSKTERRSDKRPAHKDDTSTTTASLRSTRIGQPRHAIEWASQGWP
jgi:hypothetical protein